MSNVSGACVGIVGCRLDGELQARNRTPAIFSPLVPVDVKGTS